MKPAGVLTTLITSTALAFCLGVTTALADQEYAEGRILVKPKAGLSDKHLEKILKKMGANKKGKLRGSRVGLVEAPKGKEKALAKALNRHPHIAFAQVDYKYPLSAISNDPSVGNQWHLPVMQASQAWSYSTGSDVIVAVLDTGVYANHRDLSGDVLSGYNTLSNNSDSSDFHNHGTWVSGVIAAHANNSYGGASVAPGTKILPIRVTNDGYAYSSEFVEGLGWAVEKGARVANISFSGVAGDNSVAAAAADMMAAGGVVVVAAANDGTQLNYSNSPYMFVAGATGRNDVHSDFSNYGQFVDISAPGEDIYTTNRSGGFDYVWGTSFATPNVAAVVALVMSANPSLTPTDVLAVIANTADDLGDAGWDPYYGHGRVNALAAVQMASSVETSDTTAPDVSVASPGAYQAVSGNVPVVVAATDDFGVTSVDLYVNGSKAFTETQATENGYEFSWDSTGVSDGRHRLSARAVDAAGNEGIAADVLVDVANVDDQTAPTPVVISSPRDGATVSRNVTLSGYANDDKGMAQFSLSLNGKLKCTGTNSASCGWNTRKESDGAYVVKAQAKDIAGNTSSTSITVYIGGPSAGDSVDETSSEPVDSGPPAGKGWRK